MPTGRSGVGLTILVMLLSMHTANTILEGRVRLPRRHGSSLKLRQPLMQTFRHCCRLRGGKEPSPEQAGEIQRATVSTPLSANDGERLEVESLCMACGGTGTTSILPTVVPSFGRIVVMAFSCPECHYASNEVQSAKDVQPFGQRFVLNVETRDDLNRQVIKSSHAALSLPSLDFEIPPQTRSGALSTIEGFLAQAANDLDALQEDRMAQDKDLGEKVGAIVRRLRELAEGREPFVVQLDDPSGNSFIESLSLPGQDARLVRMQLRRSKEQNEALGIFADVAQDEANCTNVGDGAGRNAGVDGHLSALGGGGTRWVSNRVAFGAAAQEVERTLAQADLAAPEDVDVIPVDCPACNSPEHERIYPTSIPHFGKIILMSFSCGRCGYRNVEVKTAEGEERPGMGKRMELSVEDARDWGRMLLKSDSSSIEIPELELKLPAGSTHQGSMLTTVEGLLSKVLEKLESTATLSDGDSVQAGSFAAAMSGFLARFREKLENKSKLTLIIDDPRGVAKIEPANDNGQDARLTVEWTARGDRSKGESDDDDDDRGQET